MNADRQKICLIACHVLWREFSHFASSSRHTIFPNFLEMGLHDSPDIMRDKLQQLIDENDNGEYDIILLGYGLCGNGAAGLRTQNTRMVMMRGHDCITFFFHARISRKTSMIFSSKAFTEETLNKVLNFLIGMTALASER